MPGRRLAVTPNPRIPFPEALSTTVAVEKQGAVYTRRWIVDLMLDLVGYCPDQNLVDRHAIEPAVGEGAFLVPMVERLVASCQRQGRAISDCARSLVAFDLHAASVTAARRAVIATLERLSVPSAEARALAQGWIRVGDYLDAALRLPEVDLVVGNPPYIRLEDLAPDALARYRSTWNTMRGRADIYVGFFEAALRQLRPGGACVFICADRWMSNQYGAGLRAFITGGFSVETVIELHDADAFEQEVSAYPAITVLRRAPQGVVAVAHMERGAQVHLPGKLAARLASARAGIGAPPLEHLLVERVQGWSEGDSPWPCASPDRLALLRRLEAEFFPLEDETTGTRVSIGVASGCEGPFLGNVVAA